MRSRLLPRLALLLLLAPLAAPLARAQSAPVFPSAPTATFTKALGGTVTWSWGAVTANTDASALWGPITYVVMESTGGAFAQAAVTQSLSAAHVVNKSGYLCGYVLAVEGGTFTAATASAPASITGGLDSAASNMDCGQVEAPPASPPGFAGG